ncbi:MULTISPECIES: hypothetical protein [unclassified Aeromonas]|uniref:hypothetical protein n=1 Tax=unclassified Aeromonas TaxID=257493 RepID=UPI0035271346
MTFAHGMKVKHVDSETTLYVEFVDGMKVTCSELGNVGVYQTITVAANNLQQIVNIDMKSCKVAAQFDPGQQVAHIMAPGCPMRVEYQYQHANAQHSVIVCSTLREKHLVTFEFDQRSLIEYEEAHQYGYPKIV